MRSNFRATRWSPRRSKRVITSPTRRRCTPSGLTRTRVRSTLTARKSDMRTSHRDRLLESGFAAERPYHRGTEPTREQACSKLAHLGRLDRLQPRNELLGLDDLPLEQHLLSGVFAERRRALELEQQTALRIFACLDDLRILHRLLGELAQLDDRCFECRRSLPRFARQADAEHSGVRHLAHERVHVVDESAVLAKLEKEATRHTLAEDDVEDLGNVPVGVVV